MVVKLIIAVRIEPGSRECTLFTSPFGMFQYIHMLFGLAKTGSVYSKMLDLAIKEVDRFSGHHTWMIS